MNNMLYGTIIIESDLLCIYYFFPCRRDTHTERLTRKKHVNTEGSLSFLSSYDINPLYRYSTNYGNLV